VITDITVTVYKTYDGVIIRSYLAFVGSNVMALCGTQPILCLGLYLDCTTQFCFDAHSKYAVL